MQIENFSHFPHQPGVYIFKNRQGSILYIGKAKNLNKRIKQYFSAGSVRKQEMVATAESVDFILADNESEALFLEDNLIKKHKPPYNNLLKGDNSYVYIKIPHTEFPEIFLTKFKQNDGALYIGPKYMRNELKKLLQFLRQLFQYRGCKSTQFRQGLLCSDFLFGSCKGRCVFAKLGQKNESEFLQKAESLGLVVDRTRESYQQEYKMMIGLIVDFFGGNIKPIKTEILKRIQESVEKQHFERAGKLRDIYTHIETFVEKQRVVLSEPLTGKFYLIKKIGIYTVYSLVIFFEGRAVDIITHKEKSDETDLDEMIRIFEREFGEFYIVPEFSSDEVPFGFQKSESRGKNGLGSSRDHKPMKSGKPGKKIIQDILGILENAISGFILSSSGEKLSVMNELLATLQSRYGLSQFPYRIECIDISHLSGGWISGGLSSMSSGILNKTRYRRYKIRSVTEQNNDYQSLEELMIRRFFGGDQHYLPDLFILDGGKGQLGVVK
ncbi:MAG TPA: GIY-YIG nuclease family protein, partial [Candidatus Absconditabacterales bacterium]|nr:GIY-YIG nuclease family protein [Candidatus Absconditabacterales bacterium]